MDKQLMIDLMQRKMSSANKSNIFSTWSILILIPFQFFTMLLKFSWHKDWYLRVIKCCKEEIWFL